jgi:hypothetical protein
MSSRHLAFTAVLVWSARSCASWETMSFRPEMPWRPPSRMPSNRRCTMRRALDRRDASSTVALWMALMVSSIWDGLKAKSCHDSSGMLQQRSSAQVGILSTDPIFHNKKYIALRFQAHATDSLHENNDKCNAQKFRKCPCPHALALSSAKRVALMLHAVPK